MTHGMVLIRLGQKDSWLATCLCSWFDDEWRDLFDARQEWRTHSLASVDTGTSELQGALDTIDAGEGFYDELTPTLDTVIKAARQVVNGKPVVRMGGLFPAYYITDDPAEADAWLIEREDIPE